MPATTIEASNLCYWNMPGGRSYLRVRTSWAPDLVNEVVHRRGVIIGETFIFLPAEQRNDVAAAFLRLLVRTPLLPAEVRAGLDYGHIAQRTGDRDPRAAAPARPRDELPSEVDPQPRQRRSRALEAFLACGQ